MNFRKTLRKLMFSSKIRMIKVIFKKLKNKKNWNIKAGLFNILNSGNLGVRISNS